MAEATVSFTFNGIALRAEAGSSVAAGLLANGVMAFRSSASGEPRAPLCGMGICMECRVRIGGRAHQKACQVEIAEGMEVGTDE